MQETRPDSLPNSARTLFTRFVEQHKSFVITTHLNPDGDALGSELGLNDYLLSIGKTVKIVNHSPTPYNFEFLDRSKALSLYADTNAAALEEFDAVIVLDVNDPDRTKSVSQFLLATKKPILVIDHHLNPKDFATEYIIDTDATSTGEMIYKLCTSAKSILGGGFTASGASALYAAIITDTGSFRFPRTDSEVLRICADLLDLGADPVDIYDEIYNTSPITRLQLIGESLHTMQFFLDHQMALQTITQEELSKTNASEEDVDGFVQIPFQVKGVRLSVLLLELKQGWKLSVRSKNDVSAASIAQYFGGNGHFHAAGARVYQTISKKDIEEQIVTQAEKALRMATQASSVGEAAQ